MNEATVLLGRILMSVIFIEGGIGKLLKPAATMGMMAHYNLPIPAAAYIVAVIVELLGGIAVLIGFRTRWAAIALSVWCVATALVAHYHPGDTNQMIHFTKNLCMAGGFLLLSVLGPGRFSIDRR